MSFFDVLIVGTGHGGAHAAVALRQHGFAGSIAIVGREPELPYERPPLSKDYLAGEKPFARLLIRSPEFWRERTIEILTARTVVRIDPAARCVEDTGGGVLRYQRLIWAAGGTPRMLQCEGHDLKGIHYVRARADVDAISAQLERTKHVAVIGGGYIGLETAAVLNKLGKKVTLIEMLPRVLARVTGEPVSHFYEAEHRAHGVDVRLACRLHGLSGRQGCVTRIELASGESVPAEMVIVGIGIIPAVAPLLAAGALSDNGVHVDEYCRTSLEDIYAIGDCAAHENPFCGGRRIRLESVQNATDQAETAARAIAGKPRPYRAVPWFWSNQYDLRLQTVGLSMNHDDVVVRGAPATRAFSVVYLKAGKVVALDCVNSTKDYVEGRKLVLDSAEPDRAQLADAAVPLKEMAR